MMRLFKIISVDGNLVGSTPRDRFSRDFGTQCNIHGVAQTTEARRAALFLYVEAVQLFVERVGRLDPKYLVNCRIEVTSVFGGFLKGRGRLGVFPIGARYMLATGVSGEELKRDYPSDLDVTVQFVYTGSQDVIEKNRTFVRVSEALNRIAQEIFETHGVYLDRSTFRDTTEIPISAVTVAHFEGVYGLQ